MEQREVRHSSEQTDSDYIIAGVGPSRAPTNINERVCQGQDTLSHAQYRRLEPYWALRSQTPAIRISLPQ